MAAKEILKWNFIDSDRVAVHGWSGGGAVTLNLMFQYPEIYKTGVAISAVTDQHFYDNIYTERYMGLPSENEAAYIRASPVTHAKNLKGNLLYIHGTGDDNVHYKNAEVLINELIKYDRMFNLMIYPNRSHSIYEGEGTRQHLIDTFIKFIEEKCPPGAK
jgi:dipeptidyl-peptidase-4